MNDVIVHSQTPGAASQATAPVGVTARIANPPPALSTLGTGHIIQGTVIEAEGKGQLLVRTDYGVLHLSTSATFPPGTEVTLEIRALGARLQVLILKAEIAAQAARLPAPENPKSLAPQHNPAAGDQVLPQRQIVRAVLQTPGETARLPEVLRNLSPGTGFQVRILSVQPSGPTVTSRPAQAGAAPTPAPPPLGQTNVPGVPPGTGAVASSEAVAQALRGASRQTLTYLLQPQSGSGALSASIPKAPNLRGPVVPTAVAGGSVSPVQPAPWSADARMLGTDSTASSRAAVLLSGTVTGLTQAGQPVVQTPVGRVILALQSPLPLGSNLTLEVIVDPVSAGRPAPLLPSWPALSELVETLQAASLAQSSLAAARLVPQAGPQLASGLLFFLSALRGGDIAGWLGNAGIVAQSPGGPSLLNRVGRELAQSSRLVITEGNTEWRFFLLPLFDGNAFHDIRLFLRHHAGTEDEASDGGVPEDATRFVVEVELSRLGGLQLDGLVHRKRFDLILRSSKSLPAYMRSHITEIYHVANSTAGYHGNIGFQVTSKWRLEAADRGPAGANPSLTA